MNLCQLIVSYRISQMTSNASAPHVECLERKSVDISGRLGSSYDAFTDNIIDRQTAQTSQTTIPIKRYFSRTFTGNQTNAIIDCFKWMNFDDAMRQSILFGMIKPYGVSCLIDHNQPINDKTRFLYCSYRSKEEKLTLTTEQANQIISSSPLSTHATHMITEIVWGFEFLCVISIPDHQYVNQIDSLLQNISNQLENNGTNLTLTDYEKHLTDKLRDIIVYGSEACIEDQNKVLSTVLTMLKVWQNHENLHHPLIYTMCPLRSLCTIKQFPEFTNSPDRTESNSGHIYSIIANLNRWIKYLKDLFEKFPNNLSNDTLNQQSKELQWQFSTILNLYQGFRNDCRKILVGVRQKRRQLSEIYNILSEQRYSSLSTTDLETFVHYAYGWHRNTTLLERLNRDQIQYMKVMDLCHHENIPVTFEYIEETLPQFLPKNDGCFFLFYSNDRLRDKEPAVWEGIYQELISKRQQTTQKTNLVYADFTNCPYDLTDLAIGMLTMNTSIKPPRNHSTGTKSGHFIEPYFFSRWDIFHLLLYL